MASVIRDLTSERRRLADELSQLDRALGVLTKGTQRATRASAPQRRKMSARGRANIAAAMRKRWAKYRREQAGK